MQGKNFTELLERYRSGKCTPDELRLLHKTFNKVPLSDPLAMEERELLDLQHQALADFQAKAYKGVRSSLPIKRILPYAAALLAAITVSLYFFTFRQSADEHQIAAAGILPGTHQATLTLDDGTVIDLSAKQEGIVINDDKITYSDEEREIVTLKSKTANHIVLSTPKGRTYSVILPDGSKVWLNAVSTLKYPSRFDGTERVVEVTGEALFTVAKDVKRPFIVVSNNQQIEVLGTEFNISAYPEDNATTTTLVDGSVKVRLKNEEGTVLKPGEQVINEAGKLNIHTVDVDQYTAWKNGVFHFKRLPLKTALAQLARWYDIEVVYEGAVPEVNLFGELDRKIPLGSVLKSLERSGLRFKVIRVGEMNRLVVLEKS